MLLRMELKRMVGGYRIFNQLIHKKHTADKSKTTINYFIQIQKKNILWNFTTREEEEEEKSK